MANIDNAFRVERLSLDDATLITTGDFQPNIGAGFEAPQGSLFLRSNTGTNGELYIKFGPADVDWQLASTSTVTLPVFGTEYQYAESPGVTTTTSTTFISKLLFTTSALPAGTYRVSLRYGWNHNSASSDFEGQFLEDAVQIDEIHKQEPKDSAGSFSTTGTSQRYYFNRVMLRTLTAGTHTYEFKFRTDNSSNSSSVWDVAIELWRVL